MSLKEKIELILFPLLSMNKWEDRYRYIIALGKTSPEFPEYLKTSEHLLSGCQSQVWLDFYVEAGRLFISGTSHSVFIRGFIHLLIKIYSRELIKEIHEDDTPFLSLIGFQEMVSSRRTSGLLLIYDKIKNYNA